MKILTPSLLCLLLAFAGLHAQDPSPIVLTPDAGVRLQQGLVKLQGAPSLPVPKIGVVAFSNLEKDPSAVQDTLRVIRDNLRAQLVAQGADVVVPEIAPHAFQGLAKALERRGEGEAAARLGELLRDASKADITLVVELLVAADGTAMQQFNAYDLRAQPVRLLVSQTYRALSVVPPVDKMELARWVNAQRQNTTAMLTRFADSTASVAAFLPTYRLQVLGLGKRDQEKWLRALRRVAGLEVLRTPSELGSDKVDVTPLWIRFAGEWLDLKDRLDESAEQTLGQALLTVYDSGAQDFIVTLQETKDPEFFRYAGTDAAAPAEKVGPVLSPNRRPTVAILVGNDLDAPRASLVDERVEAPKLGFSDEIGVRQLGRYFQSAGFEVKDGGEIRRQLDDEMTRAKLTKNLSGLRDALRRSNVTDYLVLVRTENGGRALAVTVLDTRGSQIAFADFPDLRHKLYEDVVDVRDNRSVLRYLAGGLFSQMAEQAKDGSPRSVEVVLKNLRNPQMVMEVVAAFRGVEGVKSVTDIRVDQPLASFRVNTEGDTESLVRKMTVLAAKNQFGVRGLLELANEQQLVINVAPEWVSTYDLPEAEKKAEALQDPATPKPTEITAALREARDSVWTVGIELDNGNFLRVGTAWTVQSRLLATNAHVYEGLQDYAKLANERGRNFEFVARNGPNLERKIVVDFAKSRYHPAYLAFSKKEFRMKNGLIPIYDVACLATVTDAGKPLRLATAAEYSALKPLDVIGYTGYPAESRSGGGASQQTLLGAINTITTVFLRDTSDPARRKLVHFSMPSTGGASGSPIIGPTGAVIALLSAGDNVATQSIVVDKEGRIVVDSKKIARVTSGEEEGTVLQQQRRIPFGFNYGQRVDMLQELIDNRIDLDAIVRAWDAEYGALK